MSTIRSRTSLLVAAPVAALLLVGLGGLGGCVRTTVPTPWPATDRESCIPAGGAAGHRDSDPMYFSFLGKSPPDRFRGGSWVNSDKSHCLSTLRCNVVVLAFASLKCPACAEFFPRLIEWEQKYAPEGATVVYIDNGRQDSLPALEAFAEENGIPFALFHDRLGHMMSAYGMRAFPTVYVIDRDGKVVWENVVPGYEDEAEKAIKDACDKK